MERYNLVVPIKTNSGGIFWHKIGAAFKNNGKGYTLVFNSLPIPDKDTGEVRTMMFPADDEHKNPGPEATRTRSQSDNLEMDINDKIPY